MKKQVKTVKKDSLFRKLTLGSMICNWSTLGAIIIALLGGLIDISARPGEYIPSSLETAGRALLLIGIFLAVLAFFGAFALEISQAVEGRHYGDVGGRLTKDNVTKTIIVCMCTFVVALLLLVIFVGVIDVEGGSYMVKNGTGWSMVTYTAWWYEIIQYIVAIIGIVGLLGSCFTHAIINTTIVAKLPRK